MRSARFKGPCSRTQKEEFLVRGLGGIRKARMGNPRRGKDKRGGLRFLYLYLRTKAHIHLLFLLDKDVQEDLSSAERAVLRKLISEIKS